MREGDSLERSRNEVLADWTALRESLTDHVVAVGEIKDGLHCAMRKASQASLYRYESTLDQLRDHRTALEDHIAFLAGRGTAGGKVFVGRHVFNRSGFAAYILKRARYTLSDSENHIESASKYLREEVTKCDSGVEKLKTERERVLQSLGETLVHVRRSSELGFIGPTDAVACDIKGICWLAFDVGVVTKGRRGVAERRSKELLTGTHVSTVIDRLLSAYCKKLETMLQPLLARRKHGLFEEAARSRIEGLRTDSKQYCEDNALHRTIRAIAGLRFAYACEQHLDCGKMPVTTLREYRVWLESASAALIAGAIRVMLKEGILERQDFSLLRYVTPVQEAFVEVAG